MRAAFRVVDDLGEPVEAVEARVRFALGAAATWSASEELVASDGRFECGAAATAVRRIRLAAEGHLPMETSWPVVGGVPAPEPVFTLVACTPLEVLVHDERGLAVRGARVEAWPASAGPEEARKARTLRAERVDRVDVEEEREGGAILDTHRVRGGVEVLPEGRHLRPGWTRA